MRGLVGRDDDGLIDSCIDAGFEEQRDVVHDHGMPILFCCFSGQSDLFSRDSGMDDSFELSELRAMRKHDLAKSLSIEGLVTIQDRSAKSADNITPGGLAGLDHLVCQCVGIDHNGPTALEHGRYGAFAGGDASRESDQDHGGGAYHGPAQTRNRARN